MEITKTESPRLEYHLRGNLDENSEFQDLLPDAQGELLLNCRMINRINSHGVKALIQFFETQRKKGVRITLKECSFAIVDYLNNFVNFAAGAKVESILLPFRCEKCATIFSATLNTADVQDLLKDFPSPPCAQCQGPTVFDDNPDEYFLFMRR